MLEQGEAGKNPARFNFLKPFFLLSFKSEGWWLFNKKLQINWNNILSTPFPLFLYVSHCVHQVTKLVEWRSYVR